MLNILIGSSMVIAILLNLFFCFWVGNNFLMGGVWFAIPGVVTLFVWFMSIAIFFAVVAENMTIAKS